MPPPTGQAPSSSVVWRNQRSPGRGTRRSSRQREKAATATSPCGWSLLRSRPWHLPPCSWSVVSRGSRWGHWFCSQSVAGSHLEDKYSDRTRRCEPNTTSVAKAQVHSRDLVPFNLPVLPSCGQAATAPGVIPHGRDHCLQRESGVRGRLSPGPHPTLKLLFVRVTARPPCRAR